MIDDYLMSIDWFQDIKFKKKPENDNGNDESILKQLQERSQ